MAVASSCYLSLEKLILGSSSLPCCYKCVSEPVATSRPDVLQPPVYYEAYFTRPSESGYRAAFLQGKNASFGVGGLFAS